MAISISRPVERSLRSAISAFGVGWRLVAILAVGVVVLVAGVVLVARSSLFDLRHLEVTGASHVSPAQVRRLTGLTKHVNVLWLDAGSVERALETDPWVIRADVSRSLPGTVRVAIVERAPVVAVASAGGFHLVAADGTPLATTGRSRGLPVVELPPTDLVGVRPPPVGPIARAIAGLAPPIRAAVRQVDVDAAGSLELRLRGGTVIRYGAPRSIRAKATVVRDALAWADARGARIQVLNVIAPDAPAAVLAG